ncbi:MAG: VOC family protein [Dysosmobacter welbionis]
MLTFNHFNFNVADLDKSLAFYKEALGLEPVRGAEGGGRRQLHHRLPGGWKTDFRLELTWLRDHPQKYDLGECEFHLALRAEDYEAAHAKHAAMGCICFENPAMGIYFVTDPDGYWIEIIPTR